jgi:hypothetical protein
MNRIQIALAAFLAALAAPSFAVGPDFSTLTGAVDFSTLITALLAIFAAMVGVGIVLKGGNAITRKLGFK